MVYVCEWPLLKKEYKLTYALSSWIPKTNPIRHYFFGDWDEGHNEFPRRLKPSEWLVKTPRGYHVFRFQAELTIKQLLEEQITRKCDADFIANTKRMGFAQLDMNGYIMNTGSVLPEQVKLVVYYDSARN